MREAAIGFLCFFAGTIFGLWLAWKGSEREAVVMFLQPIPTEEQVGSSGDAAAVAQEG